MTDYIYEYDTERAGRRVFNNSNDPDFQEVKLDEEELQAMGWERDMSSKVDTLVNLFTGRDPLAEAGEKFKACEHGEDESCDCGKAQIAIPAVLAFHIQQLPRQVDLYYNFTEDARKDGRTTRKFWTPHTGWLTATMTVTHDERGSVIDNRENWDLYALLLDEARYEPLNRWLDQGIALHAQWR